MAVPQIGFPQTTEKRRRRSKEERRRIVEETLVPGASVARIARAHEVNANQVFHWRKLYHRGLLDVAPSENTLLPVRIADATQAERVTPARGRRANPVRAVSNESAGTIQIQLAKARIRIEGQADPCSLRLVLECLLS